MKKVIIASGPVIVENKKVLLDKHGDDDFWKFCGGKIDDDNDLMENAKKRAKEELGIGIEITDKEPYIMHIKKDGKDVILVHYLAKRVGEVKPGAEIKKWKWVNLKELDKEKLGPNIEPTLVHFWFLDK